MNHLVYYVVLCAMVPFSLFADIIRGGVTDAATGSPLQGVTVSLKEKPQIATTTDDRGLYELNTEMTGLIKPPGIGWNPSTCILSLQNVSEKTHIEIFDTRGSLVQRQSPGSQTVDLKHTLRGYPPGLYLVSIPNGLEVIRFVLCKINNTSLLTQNKTVSIGSSHQVGIIGSRADHLLQFSKPGYRTLTKAITGSQNDVNMALELAPGCGNGVIEPGEVCDGNTKKCFFVDPFQFVQGNAACNGSCAGFVMNDCVKYPVIDVSASATGIHHQAAANITSKAQVNVLLRIRPGMIEGDFHLIIDSVYKANGSSGNAFAHITGSGPNSLELHYIGKKRTLVDGDVLLVDIGAKSNGYCGDLTRTYPVTGKFSPRQREIYQLVLDVYKASAQAMEPNGKSLNEMTTFAKELFKKSPLRSKDKNGTERTMDYFFKHSLSHYIGKDVHGSDLNLSMSQPVKTGQIFSIEPGLYLDSEGFGVRLEDDFLMTTTGAVNIFPNSPIEIVDIEELMANRVMPAELNSVYNPADYPEQNENDYNDHMDF